MSQSQRKYALIWWIDSAETDVIQLIKIPKKHRKLHAVAELSWKDNVTKRVTKSKMKVLAISRDDQSLRQILVNTKGEITTQSDKIFPTEVISKNIELKENLKLQNGIKASNKTKIDTKIKSQQSILNKIFPVNDQRQFTNISQCTSTMGSFNPRQASLLQTTVNPVQNSPFLNSFNPVHNSQVLSSLNPVHNSQLLSSLNPVHTSQVLNSSIPVPTSQPYTFYHEPPSQFRYTSMQEKNDYFSMQGSSSCQMNTDQRDAYEFPSTVETTPVCHVINLKNSDKSARKENQIITKNVNEDQAIIRDNYNENPSGPTHSGISKVDTAPSEMSNLFSKLISTKSNNTT